MEAEGDRELLDLPAPGSRRRVLALALMSAATLTAVGLLYGLRSDLAYTLADTQPLELGTVTAQDAPQGEGSAGSPGGAPARSGPSADRAPHSDSQGRPPSNVYVRLAGTPMLGHAMQFKLSPWDSEKLLFPLAGQRKIFVQTSQGGRGIARSQFAGRLVTFGELGFRYANLAAHLRDRGLQIADDTFILMADSPPSSHRWAWALAGLCGLFVCMNLLLILRWFRPLPIRPSRTPSWVPAAPGPLP